MPSPHPKPAPGSPQPARRRFETALRVIVATCSVMLVYGIVYQLGLQIEQTTNAAQELAATRMARSMEAYFEQHARTLEALARDLTRQQGDAPRQRFREVAPLSMRSAPATRMLTLVDRSFLVAETFPPSYNDTFRGMSLIQADPDLVEPVSHAVSAQSLVLAETTIFNTEAANNGIVMCKSFALGDSTFSGLLTLSMDFGQFVRDQLLPSIPPNSGIVFETAHGEVLYSYNSRMLLQEGAAVQVIPINLYNRVYLLKLPVAALVSVPEYRYLTVGIGVMMSLIVVLVYLSALQSQRYTSILEQSNQELAQLEELHREVTRLVHSSPDPGRFLPEVSALFLQCFLMEHGQALVYFYDATDDLFVRRHPGEGDAPLRLLLPDAEGFLDPQDPSTPRHFGWEEFPVAELSEFVYTLNAGGGVLVPLVARQRLLGLVVLCGDTLPGSIPEQRMDTGKGLGITLAFALDNAMFLRRQRFRTQRLQQLQELSEAVATNLNPEQVLKLITQRLTLSFGLDFSGIWLYEEELDQFKLSAYQSSSTMPVAGLLEVTPDPANSAEFHRSKHRRAPLLIRRNDQSHRQEMALLQHEPLQGDNSLAVFPLISTDRYYGLLAIVDHRDIDEDMLEILDTLAHIASVAMQDAARFDELSRSNKALETASRHKSLFLAKMSHELKTPLGTILGFSDVLRKDMEDLPPERRETFVKHIHSAANHLHQVISDILDHSKIEAGTMQVVHVPFSADEQLNASRDLVEEMGRRKNVRLGIEHTQDLPTIIGDPIKFRQVVINLLTNAVKFSHDGGEVTLRTRLVTEPHAPEMLEVQCIDRGIGIEQADLEKIFDEFSQVDDSMTRRFEGTGLGLSLVKKLLSLMEGRISVSSQIGKGTTFTFRVPVNPGEDGGYASIMRRSGRFLLENWQLDDEEDSRELRG